MSERKKPSWMTPVIYNDTRFIDESSPQSGRETEPEERDGRDIESLINRADREVAVNKTNDDTPLDYSRGPHDDELDLSDRDFVSPDDEPIDYARGEHDNEIDIEDSDEPDDELEDADPDEEYDPFA
jgi:hypothetical protein